MKRMGKKGMDNLGACALEVRLCVTGPRAMPLHVESKYTGLLLPVCYQLL